MFYNNFLKKNLKLDLLQYVILLYTLFSTYYFAKYSIWYDVYHFYNLLLRTLEGQKFFHDYFGHFYPFEFYFLAPVIKLISIDHFNIIFSLILNFSFAYHFTYFSKKIFNNEINFFYLFSIISFFFIPFGIGLFNFNELAVYFTTIGFLMAICDLKKFSFVSVIYIVLALTIKYSVAIPLICAIFISTIILLCIDYDKKIFYQFLKYFFSIGLLFCLITISLIIFSDISINDGFDYLFFKMFELTKSRSELDNFLFLRVFKNLLSTDFNLFNLPIGSILQLPIIICYFTFLTILFFKKNLERNKKLFLYFLSFSSIFYFTQLGRDWHHKFIFFFIIVYFLIFYFFEIEKKLSRKYLNFLLFVVMIIYSVIPLNERIPLRDFLQQKNFKTNLYYLKYNDSSPNIMLKRAKYHEKIGIINFHDQHLNILKYLENYKNIKLFFIDDISTVFSLLLKKAPNEPSLVHHSQLFTPPQNDKINKVWIKTFMDKYTKNPNSLLIVCKDNFGRLCTYSSLAESGDFVGSIMPTNLKDNLFLKDLLDQSHLIYKTENFYVYQSK